METQKINGFPSDMVPMSTKLKKNWHINFARAFHKNHQKVILNENFVKWRELCEGRQSQDQYKTWLFSRKRAGKNNLSWMNLDYNILPIMPKFVKILKNKILDQPKKPKIKAIDPWSINQERYRKNKIVGYMLTQEINEELKKLGVQIQSPFEEGEAVPQTLKDVDIYVDAYPKNKHVNELYDEINLALANNKWSHRERELVEEQVKAGVSGAWVYLDSKNIIRVRKMDINRVITNPVEKNDYSDMTRIGEYIMMTIGQIRVAAQKEIAKGEITEDQLVALASKVGGRQYSIETRDFIYQQARNTLNGYTASYDHEKVAVLKYQTKSTDSIAYVVTTDENGRVKVEQRDNQYWLDNKGVTDQEYSQFELEQRGVNRKVERIEQENIYHGYWVTDTDICFGYGLKSNIQRNVTSLSEAHFDGIIYSMDFDSIARQLEPALHMAQLNWLKFQQHSAKTVPDGQGINKRALTQITLANGTKLDALDLIEMRMETGNFIFSDLDANGRPVNSPFIDAPGSKVDRAVHHLNMVAQAIDLIRNILGLNEATDATSINPERGKAVSELMASNTNTALGDFYFANRFIYEEICRSIARLYPDARKNPNPGYIEALGIESQRYAENNSDRNFVDFGITIDAGWDQEKQQSLRMAAQQSLKSAGGLLEPTDIYIIENEENPEKAYMILEAKTKQRKIEREQESLRLQQANAKVQQQSTMMAEQMKQETLNMELQAEAERHARELEKIQIEWQMKMLHLKMEKGLDLDDNEKDRLNALMIADKKNATVIRTAMISANSKQRAQA